MRYYKFPHRRDPRDMMRELIPCIYYLALEDDGLTRQRMLVYEDGEVFKYDEQHRQDAHDRLQLEYIPLRMRHILDWQEISCEDFDAAWIAHAATNR